MVKIKVKNILLTINLMRAHKIMPSMSKQIYATARDKQYYRITKINKIKIIL